MTNRKHTKRALLASILSVVVCIAMLAGSTFAWFTDSVTSGKNIIKSGNLDIAASYQDVDMAAGTVSYTVPGFNRVPGGTVKFAAAATDINQNNAIISEKLWEPGAVGAKLLTVRNSGSLAAKIKLNFAVNDGGLQNALWFDFVKVEGNAVVGAFTQREMSTLAAFTSAVELSLQSKDEVSFILLYGMKEEAGNEYMGKSFSADVTILAKQHTFEKDSFDNQYDKDAVYPAVSLSELKNAFGAGGSVAMANDIAVVPTVPEGNTSQLVSQIPVLADTALDLSGKNLAISSSVSGTELSYVPALIEVRPNATLTVSGKGVVNCEAGNNTAYGIQVAGGTVIINDGTYYGAMSAVQVQRGTAIINGGFFDMAPTCKAAVPQYAKFMVNAIDSAYKNGTAKIEIKGGTFVNFDPSDNPEGAGTSYVAPGYKVVSAVQSNGETWYTVVKA